MSKEEETKVKKSSKSKLKVKSKAQNQKYNEEREEKDSENSEKPQKKGFASNLKSNISKLFSWPSSNKHSKPTSNLSELKAKEIQRMEDKETITFE